MRKYFPTKPAIEWMLSISQRLYGLRFERNDVPVWHEDVIYLDRQYIEQWSFWLDVSILFRTIPAVLRRTGAF